MKRAKSTKSIQWHKECLLHMNISAKRYAEAVARAQQDCQSITDRILKLAAQIARAEREGRAEFDQERFKP